MNLLHKMRFCDYASWSKTRSSRRHSRQCSFYLNKTPIFWHTFLCCISASTRKSWLRRRPCGCGCPDEMKCRTIPKLKLALEKQWKRIAKSIFPDWTSQRRRSPERGHSWMYRFTSIKHTLFEINPDIARRAHRALWVHSSRTCIP